MNTSLIGFHYDIARGSYLRPEVFKAIMRRVAESGFTHFLPYLENMIRLPGIERACPDVAYTPELWREFEEEAGRLGLTLVPHFNVIGHTAQICEAYPELAGEEGGQELDVTLSVVREWMIGCLRDFCAVSKGPEFLIGGDEWQTPNHLLRRYPGQTGRLWAEYLNLAVDELIAQGRRPLVWHDMLLHYPEALDLLSREATILFWFYDEDSDYPVMRTFREHGFRVVMASGCHGHLNRRRSRALQMAVSAAERHQADGLLMTNWTELCPEWMEATIPQSAELMRGGDIAPEADALTAYARWRRGYGTKDKVLEGVAAWARYPDYRDSLEAEVTGDANTRRRLHERYQFPCGPGYDRLERKPLPPVALPRVAPAPFAGDAARLEVTKSEAGVALRFQQGVQTAVVYPEYGGTLQDWWSEGGQLIDHALPKFVQRTRFLGGGYRSFTGALGFRPIWALGAHQNPNILWQHSFQWEQTGECSIALWLELAHVAVRYEVKMDECGISYRVEADVRRDGFCGGWNFNLPLCLDHPEGSRFSWGQGDILARDCDPEWLAGVSRFRVTTPNWKLDLSYDEGDPAGIFIDRGARWVTPDFHSHYRPRTLGERVTTAWRFALMPQ